MKKTAVFVLIALSLVALIPSCGKSGGNNNCSETAMMVSTDPANGFTVPPGPGPNFPLEVNITANLPSAGATITVTAAPEAGGSAFFTRTIDVTANSTSFTITNTPATTACKVDITVTSRSCASNKWTGSYRYSRK